jgi:hypothetical protein
VVGTWFDGRPTIEKFTAGIAYVAALAPWHCEQLVVVLGAYRWMFAIVGICAKFGVVWHELQLVPAANGIWFDGSANGEK